MEDLFVSRVNFFQVAFKSQHPPLFSIAVGPYETVCHEVYVRVQNNEVVQIKVSFSNED
jgi:hypothetical protein